MLQFHMIETYITDYFLCRSLVITGVAKMLAMIDQLMLGLESFGVLTEIRTHRELMEPLLTLEGAAHFSLTPDLLLDHFLVECSPDGSNKKPPEIDVHKFFCDYVQEVATRKGIINDADFLALTAVQYIRVYIKSLCSPPPFPPNQVDGYFYKFSPSACDFRQLVQVYSCLFMSKLSVSRI